MEAASMIRLAKKSDLIRITDIYNQVVESKKAVANIRTFTVKQRESWFLEHYEHERTPIYVYEDNNGIVGYCYLSAYRPGRQALESVAEISYFVEYDYHRTGIGSKLIKHCIEKAKELQYRNLLAIVMSCNDGSIALLEKYGFERWGALPDVLYIEGNVYSHFYYGLNIADEKDRQANAFPQTQQVSD